MSRHRATPVHRPRRALTIGVAGALVGLAGGVTAHAVDGTLPGGTPIHVEITSPADGAVVPYGSPVTLEGTASIGTNDAQPNVRLVYDLDVSGSTQTAAGSCGDANADGRFNTVLDCEVLALVNLNQLAITKGSIQDVGAVALGGHQAGIPGGPGDSIEGDVSPAGGLQVLTGPATDAGGLLGPDVEQTLRSARNGSPGVGGTGLAGFGSFESRTVVQPSTNFQQSVIVASNLANTASPPAATKVVVLVSDGQANVGSSGLGFGANALGQFPTAASFVSWVQSVAGSVRFITFAVGPSSTCGGSVTYGTLGLIAQATGGSCTQVLDPAQLPSILPDLVTSQLTSVTATDNGAAVPITVDPVPPQEGPADFTWSASAGPLLLAPGSHELCARAFGSDSGGSGSVEHCVTIDVVAVDAGGPYGDIGGSAAAEGTPVPIAATTNGGASFSHWTYLPGPDVDAGATCTFADPGSASTTVTCTDDGTYTLTAHSTGPDDTSNAPLVLVNADPVISEVTVSPSGPVLTGTAVSVTAPFTDAGANDTHTCTVDWGGSIGPVPGTVVSVAGAGTCSDTQTITSAGDYAISVTVTDDDAGSDAAAATTGSVTAVELTITPGSGPGGAYTGTEGAAITPTAVAPAGTTFAWTVGAIAADVGTSCTVAGSTTATPTIVCDDDGTFTIDVVATLDGHVASTSIPLVLANVAPMVGPVTASPSGSVFAGTLVTVEAPFTDAGSNDTHTCTVDWGGSIGAVAGTVVEGAGSGTCTSTAAPEVPGGLVVVAVTDDDGDAGSAGTSIEVTSVEITPGTGEDGEYEGLEGQAVHPTAVTPPGAMLSWSAVPVVADTGASCGVTDGSTASPTITCDDDGEFEIAVTVSYAGVSQTATVPLLLGNVDPVAAEPTVTPSLVAVNTAVSAASAFTDAGGNDTHTCEWSWGDGASSAGAIAAESCTGSHAYTSPGIYLVAVEVVDDDGGTGAAEYRYVVVYDPSAGFVTGGGTIDVGAGSYAPDMTLAGKGTFGFVSMYKKGATAPSGHTEFQFHAAGMNFRSTSYQWLVVSGSRAQYKGVGTLDGVEGYGFLVTVSDGDARGGDGVDRFRIKIWVVATGEVVFDNVWGATDDITSMDAQAITSGSIVIHSRK